MHTAGRPETHTIETGFKILSFCYAAFTKFPTPAVDTQSELITPPSRDLYLSWRSVSWQVPPPGELTCRMRRLQRVPERFRPSQPKICQGDRESCRDGSVVKRACGSCREPGFDSQHLHVDLTCSPGSKHTCGAQTYNPAKHALSYTHIKINKF